jgi:hypothetical protein
MMSDKALRPDEAQAEAAARSLRDQLEHAREVVADARRKLTEAQRPKPPRDRRS